MPGVLFGGNSASIDALASGGEMEYFYDEAGRVTKVIDQDGAETTYVYDLKGRVVSIKNALDYETAME